MTAPTICANLSGANLREVDLRDVRGVTNKELDQQAASLQGATMPNGQKYEDWRLRTNFVETRLAEVRK